MTQDDNSGLIGAYPVCATCQTSAIVRDAWATWNHMTGTWELQAVFDQVRCETCNQETELTWVVDKAFRTKRIRRLNDAFRRGEVLHGSIVITEGIRALGDDILPRIVALVSEFGAFSEDNDPHGEHDFGALHHQDQKIFWKIDYFDRDLKYHSPDAANPEVTCRVLTVMLASEY